MAVASAVVRVSVVLELARGLAVEEGLVSYYPMDGSCDDARGPMDGSPMGSVSFDSSALRLEGEGHCSAAGYQSYAWGSGLTACAWFKRTRIAGYMGIVSNGYHLSATEMQAQTQFNTHIPKRN